MIEFNVDVNGVQKRINSLLNRLSHREPLMRNLAATMHGAVEDNFMREGRPHWLDLKYPQQANHKILQGSGRLAASIVERSDNDSATVGTNLEYAAIHQFGGQTRAHVIEPRNKKALAFNGRVVKKVNHPGSTIPARPFLSLTDDDEENIVQDVSDYLFHALD